MVSIIMISMIGAYVAFSSSSQTVKVSFHMNADGTAGNFTTPMPVQGQSCLLDDLNMRNDRVPSVAEKYADFENRHQVVALDMSGAAVLFLNVPSHLAADGQQSVGANSYCKHKRAGELIALEITRDTVTDGWWLAMN